MADRVAQTQEINDLQDKVAEKHRRRISKAIEKAYKDVARDLQTFARQDIPLDHVRLIRTALEELYRDITRQAGAAMVDKFKRGFEWLETKQGMEDFYERLYIDYLYKHGLNSIYDINYATRKQIRATINRGLKEGLSMAEISAELVQRAPEVGEVRARIIARTETHSAAMYASTESAKRSSVPLVKEWVSVEDGRVRDFGEGDGVIDDFSHRAMNGVQVPLDDPYEVPMALGLTEKLMYPGDPAGSAANIINCRCSQVYEVADEDEEEDAAPAAKPLTPERPAFLYQTIDDPKPNAAAMNAFAEQNGITDSANLKGINAKELAPFMRYFLEVRERFDLDPLIGLGPATRFGMRQVRGANAAIYSVTKLASGRKGIFHLPTTFGNYKNYAQQQTVGLRNQTHYTERQAMRAKPYLGKTVGQHYDRMKDDPEANYNWTLNATNHPDIARRKIIYHEYGHVVHLANQKYPQMGEDINAVLRSARPRENGWGSLLSEYANTNDKEIVAESFSLYLSGPENQHYRIHPELLAVFQKYDKASMVKSFQLQEVKGLHIKEDPASLLDDGVAVIQEVLAADPKDRNKRLAELMAAYQGDDKELVEVWVHEALALEVVDTL